MGIVSSTFASLAIRFAWNCQRFLDPRYRYIEASNTKRTNDDMAVAPMRLNVSPVSVVEGDADVAVASASPSTTRHTTIEHHKLTSSICLPAENNNSLHQENRRRRATQHRYRKRPSSFDVSLIIRNKNNKNGNTTPSGLVTHSTPSTLKRQPAPGWDSTSTSGSSTDSSDDSETEFMYAPRTIRPSEERRCEKTTEESNDSTTGNKREIMEGKSMEDDNVPEEFAMSAAEEAAFRMTIGRGHFSRSKKDRFLNNLRLEKRLNVMNKEFFEMACRAHARSLPRRHSGELHRIV